MKKVTIFENVYSKKRPKFLPVDKVLYRIRDGASEDKIKQLRTLLNSGKIDEYCEGKKDLPSVCFSGTFRERYDKDIIEHSGLAILDFDKLGAEGAHYLKEELAADPYIFATWVSPSGGGVKALVRIPPIKEDHRDHYRALLARFTYADADESNCNESRVCFESFDPDIYINWNSQIWTQKKGIPEPERYEYQGGDFPDNAIEDPRKIYSILKSWMDRTDNFTDGNRHNFYVKFAFNLCEFGVSLEDSAEWVFNDYAHEKPENAKKAIKAGWESKQAKFKTKYFEDRQTPTGEKEYLTFWYVEDVKGNLKVHFDRRKFIIWLQESGFYRYRIGKNNWIFIHIQNQIAREVTKEIIQEYTLQYLEGLPDQLDGLYRVNIIDKVLSGASTFFSDVLLNFIKEVPITFHRDHKDAAYFFYQNTVVRVGPSGFYTIPYSDLPGVIWENQIIDRAFVPTEIRENDFAKFCFNVCGKDQRRMDSLRSITGYLLHNFKDLREFPCVVLMDERISDHPEGGTGKGLYTQAIKYIVGGKKDEDFPGVALIDGKNWSLEKNFAFQRVNHDTQIIMIQDVLRKFSFEKFFSVTAEGMEVEKKGKDAFYIPFDKSPKIIITTNYTVEGLGNSNERRLVEIEFAQHYNKGNTPFMEFGRLLFEGWNNEEWNAFDNYMMACVEFFLNRKATDKNEKGELTGEGILKPVDINISVKKLASATAPEFTEWANENITIGVKHNRKDLYHYFTVNYPDFDKLKTRTFNSWCKIWANYNHYSLEESKSKNVFYYLFKENGQNWDQIMEDLKNA